MHPLIRAHRVELEKWRAVMNLVGPGSADEHFLDAENAVMHLDAAGHWADLGSGAGFPGFALAAAFPELNVDLVESRAKRCVFLNHVLRQVPDVGSRVTVRCQRVEALPDAHYDGIISRAFAPPHRVLEHASRLLKPGGTVALLLQAHAATPQHDNFVPRREHTYALPGRSPRVVVIQTRKEAASG